MLQLGGSLVFGGQDTFSAPRAGVSAAEAGKIDRKNNPLQELKPRQAPVAAPGAMRV